MVIRVVDGQNETLSYGLFIGAGNPSQNQSLWPAIASNETRLASHDFCVQGSPANCEDPKYIHGHFGGDFSSTWKETPDYTSLDINNANENVNLTYGQDSLNLFTHYFDPSPASRHVVDNHPITVLSDYTSDQDVFFNSGSLGLGRASTIMKQLMDQGRINRNVFSIYPGTGYPRAGGVYNGSIVLGGYDAGRLAGDVHKYSQAPIPAPNVSPLKVHVKQMSLVTADGSSIGLVTNDGFDGYISTSQYAMELPTDVTTALSNALQGTPDGSPENVLQLPHAFAGNLTITLDDGYQIIYPSEWISNVSNRTPFSASSLTSNGSATSGPLVFGTAFLHHLYMTVDYDDNSFYLAEAKNLNNYVQPQALCRGEAPVMPAPTKLSKFVQTGMIGAIIGGLFAGMGLSWLIIYFMRKRAQRKLMQQSLGEIEKGGKRPQSGILRKRSKLGFLSFGKERKARKSVIFGDVKRVSHSDSDDNSVQEVTVNVHNKGSNLRSPGIELSSMKNVAKEKKQKKVAMTTTAHSPVSPLTPPAVTGGLNLTNTSVSSHANKAFPVASPLPTPFTATTPRTGNPLLGDFHKKFANYDDKDDSDLYPKSQQPQAPWKRLSNGHKRTASDQLRDQMGLTVQTNTQQNQYRPQASGKSKPAALPLRINPSGPDMSTARSQVIMTPGSIKTDVGSSKRHSMLRRMFPPS